MARTPSKASRDRSSNLVWTRDSGNVVVPASAAGSIIDFTGKLETLLGETARNFTIERIIGQGLWSVPASTTPGAHYSGFLAIDLLHTEQIGPGNYPEPFGDDNIRPPWIDGRVVFADHTVPASFTSPAINGIFPIDMRSKRRGAGIGMELRMFGYHDNALAANPTFFFTYSALWRLR